MKKILYFIYYIKKLKWKLFLKFLSYTKKESNKPYFYLLYDMIRSCFKYNISILEYFQFSFIDKSHEDRKTWAGTGFMYEFQKKMNPPRFRSLLEDKVIFHKDYKIFMKHIVADLEELRANHAKIEKLLLNQSGKIVFKIKDGGCGKGVLVKPNSFSNLDEIIDFMKSYKYDLVEEFIYQNSVINDLSSGGLNTIRIITQLYEEEVDIIAARIRMNVIGDVDNLAAGNMAAPINLETGIISGEGVYSDITKPGEKFHPKTGKEIIGVQIPYWNEIIDLVKTAALLNPVNRSVGWDVAIKNDGPTLIEGNREWCKLLYQLPVKQGLKKDLVRYLT